MSITSIAFILFLFATLILYYLIPRKYQWVILLLASIAFYLSCSAKGAVYVLVTATTVYLATRLMQALSDKQKAYIKEHKAELTKEEKQAYKEGIKRNRKLIMLCTLLLNIGFLCVFKYFHFALEQVNAVIKAFGGGTIKDTFSIIAPLGISFYTFQSVGYLVDVYWENISAEKNYFKVLLFVSFFPQMTQGPISEFEQLSNELFTEHEFTYRNYSWGFQRMVWGFFKKMMVADVLAGYVGDVFANYLGYSGLSTLIGAFMYSVQIYADFSGYMDIMCGFCEMLGIHLTENFERPYFSKSVAEYWRRWHISLGAWFKRYIYYPIGMSKWNRQLAKASKAKFGKKFGDNFPASVALVVVWLATGLWHGASWAYVVWGLLNGLFIILSLWTDDLYDRIKRSLRINDQTRAWQAFQTIRTFVLITFIKVLPEVGTLSQGWGLWKQIFTNWTIPHSLHELIPYVDLSYSGAIIAFGVCVLGTVAMFVISMLQRKRPFRERFNKLPCAVRIVILCGMVLLIASYGVQISLGSGGFLYAQF